MDNEKRSDGNNVRLCELFASAQLTLATAMTLFNRGRTKPVTESGFKAWLSAPDSDRWCAMSDADLAHAEAVFGPLAKPD